MAGDPDDLRAIRTIRRILLVILWIGLIGTATELLLLKHDEDPLQLVPLVLIAAACVVLVWHTASNGDASVRALQVTMACFVASGIVGVILHYRANVAFQLEVDPSARAMDLFWKAVRAKAPPALAPGTMIQMGLIGLVYTYRHPARRDPFADHSSGSP